MPIQIENQMPAPVASAPSPSLEKRVNLLGIFAAALMTYLTQWWVVLRSAERTHFMEAYHLLNQWDSTWYRLVAKYGIYKELPASEYTGYQTVAWFPGYSMVSRAFYHLFQVNENTAILLASHTACFGFWVYFFLLCAHFKWQLQTRFALMLLILAYPSAFFMVCGYSESQFLFLTLGYCYWIAHIRAYSSLLAALHGFGMSATRIVGLPLSLVPIFTDWRRKLSIRMIISGFSALGGLSYFAYCHFQFNEWNIYMHAQERYWGLTANHLAFWNWQSYRLEWQNFWNPASSNQNSVPFTLCLLILSTTFFISRRKAWSTFPRTLLFMAWVAFYINVVGLASVSMNSMIRYTHPIYVFCTLAIAVTLTLDPPPWARISIVHRIFVWLAIIASALSLLLEGTLIYRYTHLIFVA